MAKSNISKREKTLLFISVGVAAAAVFYNVIVEPLVIKWKTVNGQIEAKIILLSKNKGLLSRYKTLEEEYINYPVLLKSGRNEEEELAGALGEIEGISKKTACFIINIKPKASKKFGNYKEISFDVTTEGSIDEISRFMYEIETSEKILRIRQFTITSKSGTSKNLKASFLISKIMPA